MNILNLFVVLVSSVFVFGCSKKEEQPSSPQKQTPAVIQPQKTKKEEKKEAIKEATVSSAPSVIDFRSIEGRKLGGLYADIVGVKGLVGKNHAVDYEAQLTKLWLRKLDRKNVSEATVDNAHKPVELYKRDKRKMNLKEFAANAEKEVSLVKAKLNFDTACTSYKLNASECKVWKDLAKDVRGLDLVAYGLTELMPSAEGDLNVKILDLLVRNAGSNYMFSIPALYDDMLSLGFYQFTSLALRDDGLVLEGASAMNRHLPKEFRVAGSVVNLYNGEHHRAAYLFALHNLAKLAKQTTQKEFMALKKALKQKPGDIVTYMAVAHHAPANALKYTKRWLAKGAKGSLNKHLRGRLVAYGKKSDSNLAALEKVIK